MDIWPLLIRRIYVEHETDAVVPRVGKRVLLHTGLQARSDDRKQFIGNHLLTAPKVIEFRVACEVKLTKIVTIFVEHLDTDRVAPKTVTATRDCGVTPACNLILQCNPH